MKNKKIMRNKDVVRCWSYSLPSGSDNLCTNGQDLFSYGIKIGYTSDNKKIVYDYTVRNGLIVSGVTLRHVRLALKCADKVEKAQFKKS